MGDAGSAEDRLIARYFKPLAKHPGAFGLHRRRRRDHAARGPRPRAQDRRADRRRAFLPRRSGRRRRPQGAARQPLRSRRQGRGAARLPAGDRAAEGIFAKTGSRLSRAGSARMPTRYQCPLLGGDTDSTPGPISISIAAFGTLPQGTMVRRSGAKAGDHVFVTGTIGDAALGLRLRQDAGAGKAWKLDAAMRDHLVGALSPAAAAHRARRGGAHACIGRDGCLGWARRRSRASSAAPRTSRPTSRSRACRCRRRPRRRSPADATLIEPILTGGEDYEILCAVAPQPRRLSMPPRRPRASR